MTSSPVIRIVVADEHSIFRDGMILILNNQADMTVVGECGNGQEAVEVISRLSPDLAILDIALPGFTGSSVVAAILENRPSTRILLMATFGGDDEIRNAFQAGARGYLPKGCRKYQLLEAIRELHKGRRYFDL